MNTAVHSGESRRGPGPGPQPHTGLRAPASPHQPPLEARAHRCARRTPSSASPWSSMESLWQGHCGPVAGRPRQGAGRSWVEGGTARTPNPGTRNPRARSSPAGGARVGKGICAQQPERFPMGISCLLGNPPQKSPSGNDSPRQELLARVGDLVREIQGTLMEVAVVITLAHTSMPIAVITTT